LEFVGLACEFIEGKALANYSLHSGDEALRICGFSLVVSETLLIKIPKKMERFHADICARDAAFQERPKLISNAEKRSMNSFLIVSY